MTTSPLYTNLNVGISSADMTMIGSDYTVTVQAITPSFQCMQKDFTVKPYSCTLIQITGAFWLSSNLPLYELDYTIADTTNAVEQLKFTSSKAACTYELLMYEKDSGGAWVSHPITTNVLTITPNATPLLPG